ncbi:type II CAAX endopeptidase family protein [Aciduricibacillus chroicocephali]|uniref:Type II CAAX endopeptidase family protein n=1 Tax=Aciduricibacillus chroicocephali TaxID=3054939 RepID=A0ABY9KXR5_9BACI|nr:type II CAAX endopeptidase family protein [Bacillaceae bacterium 44XB]
MAKNYFGVIAVYIIMQFSVFLGVPLLMGKTDLSIIQANGYWSIGSFTVGLILVLLLMKPEMKKNMDRNATNFNTTIGWIILGVFLSYGAQILAGLIEQNFFKVSNESANTEQIMMLARSAPLFVIIPALIAPILEEIIFRKIIFGSMYKRMGFLIPAIISSIMFGLIHGELVHLLIYASMGFVFAYLYMKTKRIIVPIAVHMALNSISVILQYNIDPEDIDRMQQQAEVLQTILLGGVLF